MSKSSERRKRAQAARSAGGGGSSNNTLIILVAVIAIVFVGGLVTLQVIASQAPASPVAVAQGRKWGNETASVKVEIFSDFQ